MRSQSTRFNWLLALTSGVGFVSLGLMVLVVVIQFGVILARHVFGLNFLWAQEATGFAHASLIMLAIAWTFVANKHVRVDVFSEQWRPRTRKTVERLGILLLLFPGMTVIFFSSLGYVQNSWVIFEGSQEVSGLPGLFLIKTLLPVSAVLVMLAGLLRLLASAADDA